MRQRRRAGQRPTSPVRSARHGQHTVSAETGSGATGAVEAGPAAKSPPPRRSSQPKQPTASGPHRLIATAGPDPNTPIEEVWLTVGVFIGVHGVRGDAKMRLLTDDPEHLTTIRRLYLDDEPVARRVQGIRLHAGNALVKLQGINNPEAARTLQGKTARIAGSDARPLEEGEYRLYQLIGLEVVDEAGARIGTVTDLLETGANDVFVIEPGGGAPDVLLPYHESVVLRIDPDAGSMIVRPPTYYGE